MRLSQKLRIVESNNLNIVVKDDTGFENVYNPRGYRGNIKDVDLYVFVVEDLIRAEEFTYLKEVTEPIQYGVEVTLTNEEGKYKDSLYLVQMYTFFDIEMYGDGFKGLDFISNVAGASSIDGNYSALISGTDVYKILKVERDTVFLDKPLKEDLSGFKLGFYDEKNVSLYTDIQDSIIKATELLTECCSDAETINKLASLHLYLKGVEESTKRGSYKTAEKLLNYAKGVSRQINKCATC